MSELAGGCRNRAWGASRPVVWLVGFCALTMVHVPAIAQSGGSLPLLVGSGHAVTSFSEPIQVLLFLAALSFLQALLFMITGFSRNVIVLSLLRHALGTQSAPPNEVILG